MVSAELPRPRKRRQLFPQHPTQTHGWPVQSGTWSDIVGSLWHDRTPSWASCHSGAGAPSQTAASHIAEPETKIDSSVTQGGKRVSLPSKPITWLSLSAHSHNTYTFWRISQTCVCLVINYMHTEHIQQNYVQKVCEVCSVVLRYLQNPP